MEKNKIFYSLKDEQINILAMTKGFQFKNKNFIQTILCKKVQIKKWYILVPKLQKISVFSKSSRGLIVQNLANDFYGDRFEKFPLTYVAYSEYLYRLPDNKNTYNIWEQICTNIFPLWDPISPKSHVSGHNSDIVLFRVYKTNENLESLIENKDGRRPSCKPYSYFSIDSPVISDEEFSDQKTILEDILYK